MPMKTFCKFLLTGTLCALGAMASALETSDFPIPAAISPSSGVLFDGQNFDLVIHTPGLYLPQDVPPNFLNENLTVYANIDGVDASAWLKGCLKPVWASDVAPVNVSFVCAGQSANVFKTPGAHSLDVKLAITYGPTFHAQANYQLVKTTASLLAPLAFTVQSNKQLNPTKLFLKGNERLRITASGWVSTWPANGVRLLGPRGASAPCYSLCLFPNASAGALLVKIGESGKWRPVGDAVDIWADYPGEVIFAVNDNNSSLQNWTDNVGTFQVVISRF